MYQQLYEIYRNIERVMELYSEELRILDRNTVQLMIDEMQDEINEQKVVLNQKDEQLSLKEQQISRQARLQFLYPSSEAGLARSIALRQNTAPRCRLVHVSQESHIGCGEIDRVYSKKQHKCRRKVLQYKCMQPCGLYKHRTDK